MKLKFYFLISFFSSLVTFSLSAQTTINLKAYYFPYQNFFEPIVYKYVNLDNPNDIFYCLMETKIVDGDTLVITNTFDQAFYEVDAGEEKITAQGTELSRYTIYITGILTPTRPIHKDIFRWQQTNKEKIKWSARYSSPFGEESIRKMREYVGTGADYIFQKKTYPSILFKDSYRHSIKANKSVRTSDFHQLSLYCKGIGLVDYQREMDNGLQLHYQLEKIISKEAWDALKKQPYVTEKPIKKI
ncbi:MULTISPECIES: hypothetical protein [unclassified Aureispira]|uniref:hypothetical protein n=1 Tax=unclassified Aureispira TaxID=2649989 RepID=UPI00069661E1|nr:MULTISPECIES: hypothetical protein [unclassified Aureispira]WMX13479.1 hypothetical protein QP953_21765 [Aureispira sp. CCB-E]